MSTTSLWGSLPGSLIADVSCTEVNQPAQGHTVADLDLTQAFALHPALQLPPWSKQAAKSCVINVSHLTFLTTLYDREAMNNVSL